MTYFNKKFTITCNKCGSTNCYVEIEEMYDEWYEESDYLGNVYTIICENCGEEE